MLDENAKIEEVDEEENREEEEVEEKQEPEEDKESQEDNRCSPAVFSDEEARNLVSLEQDEEEVNIRTLIRVDTRDESVQRVTNSTLIKHRTLGITSAHSDVNYNNMKKFVKSDKMFLKKVIEIYRNLDKTEYENFVSLKIRSKKVQRVFSEYYLLNKNYAECSLVYLLNSYDETGLSRLFQSFYLEFDDNHDLKMQIDEMEKCIEFLAKDAYVGKEKMIATLLELGVDCRNNFTFFQEGGAAQKVLNEETCNKLFQLIKYKETGTKSKEKEVEHADFTKIAPILMIFFFEYMVKIFLRKRGMCQVHLGFPYKVDEKGKQVPLTGDIQKPKSSETKAERSSISSMAFFSEPKLSTIDPERLEIGEPSGLYRAFVTQLKGETKIKEPILTFRTISKALIAYRSSGFSESLTMEAIERIIKKVREIMNVDPVSGKEACKCSMKELLPMLAARISTETTWKTTKFRQSIEKYDHLVNWLGGMLCMNLRKHCLDKLVAKAFSRNKTPTFEQFVKGLDFILRRTVPTLDSPAAIFIGHRILNTPDAVISGMLSDDGKTRIKISYVIEQDDLFERLYQYTMSTQVSLVFVRLLYKTHYQNYKKFKGINRLIREYNDIMTTENLFEGIPGKLGNFEEKSKTLKQDSAEDLQKELEIRNEMKKKKFLESLFSRDPNNLRKKSIRKTIVATKSILKSNDKDNEDFQFKRAEKLRLMELQAKANEIDRLIGQKELEKEKIYKKTKESNAFPNDPNITPDMILTLIKYTNHDSEVIKRLEDYIYNDKESVNYQDIMKFLVSEDIKARGQDDEIIKNSKTKYILKDFRDADEKNSSRFDARADEEELFQDLIDYHNSNMTLNNIENRHNKEQKASKDRGCECIIS